MTTDSRGGPAMLRVTQTRSAIGVKPKHRSTLRALGLRRPGRGNTLPDRREIRGMIHRVRHLVEVETLDEAPGSAAGPIGVGAAAAGSEAAEVGVGAAGGAEEIQAAGAGTMETRAVETATAEIGFEEVGGGDDQAA